MINALPATIRRALVASVALASVTLAACGGWETEKRKFESPDGKYVARLVEVDSGATGGVWTEVHLSRGLSIGAEEVYHIQGITDNVTVRWAGPRDLEIVDPKLRTAEGPRRLVPSYDGVRIHFRPE